jgi:hypothetical protein
MIGAARRFACAAPLPGQVKLAPRRNQSGREISGQVVSPPTFHPKNFTTNFAQAARRSFGG